MGADDLYGVEPSAFVAARGELVKRLKADGDKEGAKAVAALRKPSIGAWALNTVARQAPDLIAAALESGRGVRAASRDDLRACVAAEGAATRAVVAAASDVSGRADHDLDVAATVRAAADDHDLAERIRAGTITELRTSSGFAFDLEAAPDPPPALRAVPQTDDGGAADEVAAEGIRRAAQEEAAASERARIAGERARLVEARIAARARADDARARADGLRQEVAAADDEAEAAAAEVDDLDARLARLGAP